MYNIPLFPIYNIISNTAAHKTSSGKCVSIFRTNYEYNVV